MSSPLSKESQNVLKLVGQAANLSAMFNGSATLKAHKLSLADVAALEALTSAKTPVALKRFAAALGATGRVARGRLRALEKAGLATLGETARDNGKTAKTAAATDKAPAFIAAVAAEIDAAMQDGGAAKMEKRLNRIARSARVLGATAGGGGKKRSGGRKKTA